jgi:spectinomycin phosphotransferase
VLEKPPIEDEKIVACLKNTYGITVTEIEFLPIGHDSYAGVYRVQANGQVYFLKVKSDVVNILSVMLPRYLKEHGFEQIVAPLPTITHELWGKVNDFTLLLYPFIEGQSGMRVGLSDPQWIEFGAILKRLHSTQLPRGLLSRIPKEGFIPSPRWSAVVKQLQATVQTQTYDHLVEKELAAFWREKHQEIGAIMDRAEELGRVLQRKSLDFVLCHADIHTNNLLIDTQGKLFVVDWDQPILAPKECDLLFVTVGAFVSDERHEELFFQGYGKVDIDPLVMTYYQYTRAVEDLGSFGEQVFLMASTDESKRDALRWVKVMFGPGNTVESAYKWDGI